MSRLLRVALLASSVIACPAAAQDPPPEAEVVDSWTLLPAQPTTRTFVQLRYDSTGCSLVEDIELSTDRSAREIIVSIGEGDLCHDYTFSHVMAVGYLPPGNWRIRFFGCPAQDMTICTPTSRPDLLFSVADEGRPRSTIPAWSVFAASGLAGILGWLALVRLRSADG